MTFHITPAFLRAGVVAGFVLRQQFTTETRTVVQDGIGPDGEPVQFEVEVDVVVASLVPLIGKGVLFAQGTMYRPGAAPVLPAAPASALRYLHYNSGTGFYWSATAAPTTGGDATLGWVLTDGTGVVETCARTLGSGPESTLPAAGAPSGGSTAMALISTPLDLGVIAAPTTITAPVVPGALLYVHGVMDGTGHAVTWSAEFLFTPEVPDTPGKSIGWLFFGLGDKWRGIGGVVGVSE